MEEQYEQVFPSTQWKWIRARVAPSARGKTQRGRSPHRWFGLHPWPRGEFLTIRVKFTAGNECWYYIDARGRKGAFPGSLCLHDVIGEVMAIL